MSIFSLFFFRVRLAILFFISIVCTLLFMHYECDVNVDKITVYVEQIHCLLTYLLSGTPLNPILTPPVTRSSSSDVWSDNTTAKRNEHQTVLRHNNFGPSELSRFTDDVLATPVMRDRVRRCEQLNPGFIRLKLHGCCSIWSRTHAAEAKSGL